MGVATKKKPGTEKVLVDTRLMPFEVQAVAEEEEDVLNIPPFRRRAPRGGNDGSGGEMPSLTSNAQ